MIGVSIGDKTYTIKARADEVLQGMVSHSDVLSHHQLYISLENAARDAAKSLVKNVGEHARVRYLGQRRAGTDQHQPDNRRWMYLGQRRTGMETHEPNPQAWTIAPGEWRSQQLVEVEVSLPLDVVTRNQSVECFDDHYFYSEDGEDECGDDDRYWLVRTVQQRCDNILTRGLSCQTALDEHRMLNAILNETWSHTTHDEDWADNLGYEITCTYLGQYEPSKKEWLECERPKHWEHSLAILDGCPACLTRWRISPEQWETLSDSHTIDARVLVQWSVRPSGWCFRHVCPARQLVERRLQVPGEVVKHHKLISKNESMLRCITSSYEDVPLLQYCPCVPKGFPTYWFAVSIRSAPWEDFV